ncbi:hypothetical protein, partial [Mycolicibacterium obuense]
AGSRCACSRGARAGVAATSVAAVHVPCTHAEAQPHAGAVVHAGAGTVVVCAADNDSGTHQRGARDHKRGARDHKRGARDHYGAGGGADDCVTVCV